jgi:hypothetical protein
VYLGLRTNPLARSKHRIFDDLMMGKSLMAHNFDELGILDPEVKVKVSQRSS